MIDKCILRKPWPTLRILYCWECCPLRVCTYKIPPFVNILSFMLYLPAGLVNAILVFVTSCLAVPSLVFLDSRFWLKLQGWMIVACSIFTLVLGLIIWIETLKTRAELSTVWGGQTVIVQSFLQQKVQLFFFLSFFFAF